MDRRLTENSGVTGRDQRGRPGTFVHPDATGGRPSSESRFVERSAKGTDTVVRVLRWESERGWSEHIKNLPRGHRRPAVYCPYCGMKGVYAHTDRHKYFRHSDGEQFCVEEHRMTALHHRAQVVLRDGLKKARERVLPLTVDLSCKRCEANQSAVVLDAGAWDAEAKEVSWRPATKRYFRLDVAATALGCPLVALEVKVTHAVDDGKINELQSASLPFLEFDAEVLVGLDGVALWTGEGSLPAPLVWRLPGIECPVECTPCTTTVVAPTLDAPSADQSAEQALRAWADRAAQGGIKLTAPCIRCTMPSDFKLATEESKIEFLAGRDAPPRVQVRWRERPAFDVVISAGRAERASGCIVYADESAVLKAIAKPGPAIVTAKQDRRGQDAARRLLICRGCRQASDSARAVDRLWDVLSRQSPELIPRLRRAVAARTEMEPTALDDINDPFAMSVDADPETWVQKSGFDSLARRGFRGRVHGLRLLGEILDLPGLEEHWDDVESATSDPHGHLTHVLMSGAKVPLNALVLADCIATQLRLPELPSRQTVWVLEALVDANGSEHTAWTVGLKSLADRADLRWRKAYGRNARPAMPDSSLWVNAALGTNQLVKVQHTAGDAFALPANYTREEDIARRVHRLSLRDAYPHLDPVSTHTLDQVQEEAVRLAVTSKLCVITGGAGTGKTTVISTILDTLSNEKWIILAPTGKAVQRVHEAVGVRQNLISVQTVAKALTRGSDTFADVTGIIVDEVGFVDLDEFQKLLHTAQGRLRSKLKHLVLVGDPHQLPSIEAGRVLADLLEARDQAGNAIIPCVTLKEGYRAQQSIAQFADSVLRGEPKMEGIEYRSCYPNQIVHKVLAVLQNSPANEPLPQVLAQRNVDVASINAAVQDWQNPRGARINGQLRNGDRVMCTKNRYDLPPTMNGEIGTLQAIGEPPHRLFAVEFGAGDVRTYPFEALQDFRLAYAVTVHKAQGSEWPRVVLAIGSSRMLSRSMLYTAATRAKRGLAIVGHMDDIRSAAKRDQPRRTLLRRLLERQVRSSPARISPGGT
jgi:hypothetical protein